MAVLLLLFAASADEGYICLSYTQVYPTTRTKRKGRGIPLLQLLLTSRQLLRMRVHWSNDDATIPFVVAEVRAVQAVASVSAYTSHAQISLSRTHMDPNMTS